MNIVLVDEKNIDNQVRAIADLESRCFLDAWSEDSCRDSLQRAYNLGFTLWDDNRFCGYLLANMIQGDSELLRVAVPEELRGRGYGRLLLTTYLQLASASCERSILEVRSQNAVAKRLYEQLGYRYLTTRRDYYRNPKDDGDIYQIEFKKEG